MSPQTQFLHQRSLLQTMPPSLPKALEESVMGREDQQAGLSSGIDSRAALARDKLAQEDSFSQGFKGLNSEKT